MTDWINIDGRWINARYIVAISFDRDEHDKETAYIQMDANNRVPNTDVIVNTSDQAEVAAIRAWFGGDNSAGSQ